MKRRAKDWEKTFAKCILDMYSEYIKNPQNNKKPNNPVFYNEQKT